MRSFLLITISVLASSCASVEPTAVAVPITSHAVSASDYPADSLKAQEQGTAALRYVVVEDGTIGDVQVLTSSGFSRLDEAAATMVRSRWRYQPATLNGRPVRSVHTANVAFVLGTPLAYSVAFEVPGDSPAETALSREAQTLIEPVYAAYREVERRHAEWPAAIDNTERLIRMGEMDRAGRNAYARVDLSSLEPEQRSAALHALQAEITRHDVANQAALKAMLPPEGWFLKSQFGQGAVQSAFDVVYHAVNDNELQRSALAAIEPMVARGEIRAQAYAMLYDRVAAREGRPQRYGSEMICRDQRWVLAPLENAQQVDVWRTTIGFSATLEQHVAGFRNAPPCG